MVIFSKVNVHTVPLTSPVASLKYERAVVRMDESTGKLSIYDRETEVMKAFIRPDMVRKMKKYIAKSPDGTIYKGVTVLHFKEALSAVGDEWKTFQMILKMDLTDHYSLHQIIKQFIET